LTKFWDIFFLVITLVVIILQDGLTVSYLIDYFRDFTLIMVIMVAATSIGSILASLPAISSVPAPVKRGDQVPKSQLAPYLAGLLGAGSIYVET
jgi:hypothetical protein